MTLSTYIEHVLASLRVLFGKRSDLFRSFVYFFRLFGFVVVVVAAAAVVREL